MENALFIHSLYLLTPILSNKQNKDEKIKIKQHRLSVNIFIRMIFLLNLWNNLFNYIFDSSKMMDYSARCQQKSEDQFKPITLQTYVSSRNQNQDANTVHQYHKLIKMKKLLIDTQQKMKNRIDLLKKSSQKVVKKREMEYKIFNKIENAKNHPFFLQKIANRLETRTAQATKVRVDRKNLLQTEDSHIIAERLLQEKVQNVRNIKQDKERLKLIIQQRKKLQLQRKLESANSIRQKRQNVKLVRQQLENQRKEDFFKQIHQKYEKQREQFLQLERQLNQLQTMEENALLDWKKTIDNSVTKRIFGTEISQIDRSNLDLLPRIQQINVIEQKSQYDPLASTFQLTGFNKSSLGKFKNLKKKKHHQSNKFLIRREEAPITQKSVQTTNLKTTERQKTPKMTNNSIQPKHTQIKTEMAFEMFLEAKDFIAFQQELKAAQKLQSQQKSQKAFELYTKMYKTYKKDDQKQIILLKIANLFEKQQKYDQAERTFLKCTKFNNAEAFFKLGTLQLKKGQISNGVENLEKSNCIKRNDIQIQTKLVYGYSLKEQTMQKALNLAQMILKKEPQSLQTLIITANILQKQGKLKQAIQIMTAIDKVKEAQSIKHYLGLLFLQDSNVNEAYQYFKAALSIKPDYVPSLIEVATIISQVEPKESISILKKVLEIQPHNSRALARLGKIYESIENDFGNAMATYHTALETKQNYESYMKIGDCLSKQQSYIQALINYKEALNLRKTHQAYAKLALMFQKKEQLAKAIQNYQLALQILGEDKQANIVEKKRQYLMNIGKLCLKTGSYDSAIAYFEQIDDRLQSLEVYQLLASAYFGKKEYDISLQLYQKANEISKGENIKILQCIAVCFDKKQEYMASKTIYEKILQKDPDNVRCLNNLANIFLIIGQTNQAFYMYQTLLEKAPKNLEKRLKVSDIYSEVGDWSKVQFHLLQCLKIKENDSRVLERLINLYKQKRDMKMVNKYQKKLAIIRNNQKKQKNTTS